MLKFLLVCAAFAALPIQAQTLSGRIVGADARPVPLRQHRTQEPPRGNRIRTRRLVYAPHSRPERPGHAAHILHRVCRTGDSGRRTRRTAAGDTAAGAAPDTAEPRDNPYSPQTLHLRPQHRQQPVQRGIPRRAGRRRDGREMQARKPQGRVAAGAAQSGGMQGRGYAPYAHKRLRHAGRPYPQKTCSRNRSISRFRRRRQTRRRP